MLLGAAAFMVSLGTRILDPLLKILASPREFHVPLDQAALTEINELALAAGEELERQRRAVRDARVDD